LTAASQRLTKIDVTERSFGSSFAALRPSMKWYHSIDGPGGAVPGAPKANPRVGRS
jgi:hypothetical protein